MGFAIGIGISPTLGQGGGVPAWAAGDDFWLDFAANIGRDAGVPTTPAAKVTETRANTEYMPNAAGIYLPFTSNVIPRTDLGMQAAPARTNACLWNRDLTNAAWTKSNVTAALDQTGIDGVAVSASSITATAGNGTVLQAITLGSSARWQSAFVKRITGSGTINMTMDNGTTWTAITATSAWTRVEIPTQTLANPTVGFRIVTSGDAIAVDFVQNENSGDFASAPILVTTASAAGNGDREVIDVTGRATLGLAGLIQIDQKALAATNTRVLDFNDGTTANRFGIFISSANFVLTIDAATVWQGDTTIAARTSGHVTLAFAISANFATGQLVGGSAVTPDSTVTMPTLTKLNLGGRGFDTAEINYHVVKKLSLKFGAQDATSFAAMFAKAQVAHANF